MINAKVVAAAAVENKPTEGITLALKGPIGLYGREIPPLSKVTGWAPLGRGNKCWWNVSLGRPPLLNCKNPALLTR